MDDIEKFAHAIRVAGSQLQQAELDVARAEAEEKKLVAQCKVQAQVRGEKTNAAQDRFADEDENVFDARISKGMAKGALAAAKADLMAAEVEFKAWQSKLASERAERRVYGA